MGKNVKSRKIKVIDLIKNDKPLLNLMSSLNKNNMNKNGISNTFLEQLSKMMLENATNFTGVHLLDSWNIPDENNWCSIINLMTKNEAKNQQTGHFVSIISNGKFILYFDPLGLPPTREEIRKKLIEKNLPVYFNHKTIQSTSSNYCGLFCLLFLLKQYNKGENVYFTKGDFDSKNNMRCIKYLKSCIALIGK